MLKIPCQIYRKMSITYFFLTKKYSSWYLVNIFKINVTGTNSQLISSITLFFLPESIPETKTISKYFHQNKFRQYLSRYARIQTSDKRRNYFTTSKIISEGQALRGGRVSIPHFFSYASKALVGPALACQKQRARAALPRLAAALRRNQSSARRDSISYSRWSWVSGGREKYVLPAYTRRSKKPVAVTAPMLMTRATPARWGKMADGGLQGGSEGGKSGIRKFQSAGVGGRSFHHLRRASEEALPMIIEF